jgi:hypothetical protein
MSRDEIQKLLGGYATDTLSDAERRALFAAALDDQELFDTLAKEQALRDVLQDPSARQQLIDALGPAREPFAARAWRRLRQPPVLAMAGGMLAVLIGGGLALWWTRPLAHREVLVADALVRQPAPPLAAPLSAARPRSVQRKLFRPPPARASEPSAPLPTPPALPATRPAAPLLPRVGTAAVGGYAPAGAAGATRAMMQAAAMPARSFIARSGAPMISLKKAKATPSAAANLAVGYTLLLKNADGGYSPVPSGAVFHAGDSVRLRVDPNEAGYIYLLRHEETAAWSLVEGRSVEKAQHYELPSIGGFQSDVPAQVELLLVFSRVEQNVTPDALASQAHASSRITIEYR